MFTSTDLCSHFGASWVKLESWVMFTSMDLVVAILEPGSSVMLWVMGYWSLGHLCGQGYWSVGHLCGHVVIFRVE